MGATPDYVEAVCQFRGKAGKLYAALLAPLLPDGAGFIEDGTEPGEKPTPFVRIHDWHDTNGQMIVSWKNGCKGGRKKTRGLPTDSPTDNPPRADKIRVEKRTTPLPNRPFLRRAGSRCSSTPRPCRCRIARRTSAGRTFPSVRWRGLTALGNGARSRSWIEPCAVRWVRGSGSIPGRRALPHLEELRSTIMSALPTTNL